MSRVLQKNKPVVDAASQDFINAILHDGPWILSNKNKNNGPEAPDACRICPIQAAHSAAHASELQRSNFKNTIR
jgi:hypothetical protein